MPIAAITQSHRLLRAACFASQLAGSGPATRLLCAMALVVSWHLPAAAIGPDDPAATYYERCVLPPGGARVRDEGCDALINDALMGVIVGQFDQKHPAFCYPQKLVDQMHGPADMRAAVARYMREHPERLSEKTLEVIFAALLQGFPCPG